MQETLNRFKNIFSLLSYLCEYKFTYDDQGMKYIYIMLRIIFMQWYILTQYSIICS